MHKSHCKRGHKFKGKNLHVNSKGYWVCRACKRYRADRTRATPQGKAMRRRHRIKLLYGLTPEKLIELLVKQNNCCLLCDRPFTERKPGREGNGSAWVVDHCHKTKKFRGLIHQKCNFALGYLEDSPDLCIKAAYYLERFNAIRVEGSTKTVLRKA
jgi:hypothetical protein